MVEDFAMEVAIWCIGSSNLLFIYFEVFILGYRSDHRVWWSTYGDHRPIQNVPARPSALSSGDWLMMLSSEPLMISEYLKPQIGRNIKIHAQHPRSHV